MLIVGLFEGLLWGFLMTWMHSRVAHRLPWGLKVGKNMLLKKKKKQVQRHVQKPKRGCMLGTAWFLFWFLLFCVVLCFLPSLWSCQRSRLFHSGLWCFDSPDGVTPFTMVLWLCATKKHQTVNFYSQWTQQTNKHMLLLLIVWIICSYENIVSKPSYQYPPPNNPVLQTRFSATPAKALGVPDSSSPSQRSSASRAWEPIYRCQRAPRLQHTAFVKKE